MKPFVLLIVLALAGAGAFYQFYLKDHPMVWMQGPERPSPGQADGRSDANLSPTGKKDFKEVSTLLQGDMDHIPMNLHDPRQMPSHAFDIRSRVAPYVQMHGEYQTLTQVCDTIISADQDFEQRQGKCGIGPEATGQDRARAAAGSNGAIYQQQQTLWDSRRRQADTETRLKLATLENRRL